MDVRSWLGHAHVSENVVDDKRHHAWTMDAVITVGPWTLSWLGHGCSLVRFECGRYHGWVMDALCSERSRP